MSVQITISLLKSELHLQLQSTNYLMRVRLDSIFLKSKLQLQLQSTKYLMRVRLDSILEIQITVRRESLSRLGWIVLPSPYSKNPNYRCGWRVGATLTTRRRRLRRGLTTTMREPSLSSKPSQSLYKR